MTSVVGPAEGLPDQAGYPTFVTNAFNVASALNKNMFQLWNANPSNRLFIHSLIITNEQQAVIAGVRAQYVIGRSSALGAGFTSRDVVPFDTTKALPVNIQSTTGGTASVVTEFARILISTNEWASNTGDAEGITAPAMNTQNLLPQWNGSRSIVLNSNEGLIVNCLTNNTTGLHTIRCVFSVGS
jgi:hypothetical protein